MFFKDPIHLDLIAPIVLHTLKLPREPKNTIGTYRKLVLDKMCRELEKLIKIHKSKRARDMAEKVGISGDLSDYSWAKRKLIEKDGNEGFHFEHTETVYELAHALDGLVNPTIEDIKKILARARVTWVTKTENDKLDSISKYRRPDWRSSYAKAEIEIIEDD